MAGKKRVHIFVTGRVQGVFYRATAANRARELGLTGFARNLPDGRVEIVAEGPVSAVDGLIAWCRQGPPMSRVDNVVSSEEEVRNDFTAFSIRR